MGLEPVAECHADSIAAAGRLARRRPSSIKRLSGNATPGRRDAEGNTTPGRRGAKGGNRGSEGSRTNFAPGVSAFDVDTPRVAVFSSRRCRKCNSRGKYNAGSPGRRGDRCAERSRWIVTPAARRLGVLTEQLSLAVVLHLDGPPDGFGKRSTVLPSPLFKLPSRFTEGLDRGCSNASMVPA